MTDPGFTVPAADFVPVASTTATNKVTTTTEPHSVNPIQAHVDPATNGAAHIATSGSITLRPPSTKPFKSVSAHPVPPPTLSWLEQTWHVTHSTLPMWKKNRNVQIKYTALPGGQLDDLVTYQSINGDKIKTVHGVDKPENIAATSSSSKETEAKAKEEGNWAWHWRGKGLLMIATSRWEVLGYGDEAGTDNKWVVVHFAKTLFTPAGVDFYSSGKQGLKKETIEAIKDAFQGLGHAEVGKLAKEIFEIKMDDGREGK